MPYSTEYRRGWILWWW